tara:strand:+ start:6698 stop:7087 length:390 start_codon:yes stop_codon:yes gene_type:complete
MNIDINIITAVSVTAMTSIIGLVAFVLKYWFNKLNKSQDIIIGEMRTLTEHRAITSVKLEGLKEQNVLTQKSMFKEISELSKSVNISMEKLMIRSEKNTIDILNLKSEHKMIATEIRQIKRNTNKINDK